MSTPSFNIISLGLIDSNNIAFDKWYDESGYCPPLAPQVYIYNVNSPTISNNVSTGFQYGIYYRMPVSTTNFINGQPYPKYGVYLNTPYFAIVYPAGDIYAGEMLIKTTESIFLNSLPGDITVLTQQEVQAELSRVVGSQILF
jgi:hypothetical protein